MASADGEPSGIVSGLGPLAQPTNTPIIAADALQPIMFISIG